MAATRRYPSVSKIRGCEGQVATALNLIIGLLIVGCLAIMAYEMARILLAREQLKSCVDIAALAGEASLLSSTQTYTLAQATAKETGLNMFRRNAILGNPMTTVSEVPSPTSLSPSAGEAQLYFKFVDPVSGTVGGPNSNVLQVTGAYSYQLFGGELYGFGNSVYTVAVATKASLPALDMYVLLDISGSMDDQTPVTWVLKKWDPTGNGGVGAPTYSIPPPPNRQPGTIADVTCTAATGSGTNAIEPQALDQTQTNPEYTCEACFSEVVNVNNPTSGTDDLRGITEPLGGPGLATPGDSTPVNGGLTPPLGIPGVSAGASESCYIFEPHSPDNFDPLFPRDRTALRKAVPAQTKRDNQIWDAPASAAGQTYDDCTITHMVVNIDGNTNFVNKTMFTFDFPNYRTLVEASLNNLESPAAVANAKLDMPLLGGVTPTAGYRDAYRIAAAGVIEPLFSVESAISTFLNKVRFSTDPHFGFIAFSDTCGSLPNSTFTDFRVSWAYPQGGTATYPLPGIHVDPLLNNHALIDSTITVPTVMGSSTSLIAVDGSACTATALRNTLNRLDPLRGTATTRTGAARAIVLVTDSTPSVDMAGVKYSGPPANALPISQAQGEAAAAKAAGIPIYVVAISQNGQMAPLLDDNYNDTNPGGIAYESGNGAKYYRVNWVSKTQCQSDLNAVFGNIARQLVNLVK
ncbi:MAG: hypothetical protein K2X93_07605 [Candidatus Obscuribacterales bacterium]|nr:hypothetical protein [Candidatus Obscuribacterales bacterium]